MPDENVEQARRFADAYSRRDIEAVIQELDPEIEWHAALPAMLGGPGTVYRGYEGMRALFREVDEAFVEFRFEVSEVRDLGDRVVTIGTVRARGRASGAAIETPMASVAHLKDGRGIRVRSYLDPAEALKAAGLSD